VHHELEIVTGIIRRLARVCRCTHCRYCSHGWRF